MRLNRKKLAACLFLVCVLPACQADHIKYAEKADDIVETRLDLGDDQARSDRLEWFDFFGSEQLLSLVSKALKNNPSMEIAWNRLEEAQAVAKAAKSMLFPRLTAGAEASRLKQRTLPLGFSGQFSNMPGFSSLKEDATHRLTIYNASLAAAYEVDIWGRIQSRVKAADFAARAGRHDYDSLAMTLASGVAQKWIQVKTAKQAVRILEKQRDVMEQQIEIKENRLGSGLIRGFEVSRQEEYLNRLKGELTLKRLEYELAKNQLAILLGEPPQTFSFTPDEKLPQLEPAPPLGLSTGLLQRRPDVQAALMRLRRGDQNIAAAVADTLPELQLGASLFTNAVDLKELGNVILYTLKAVIEDTLFDGGYEKAEIEAAMARTRQALYHYKKTVLNAFKEIADSLENEKKQREQIGYLEKQMTAARRGVDLAHASYVNGAAAYDSFLEALMRVHQLESGILRARHDLLLYRIQLHRALGGRWPENLDQRLSGERHEG